jgi:hypothetical protein
MDQIEVVFVLIVRLFQAGAIVGLIVAVVGTAPLIRIAQRLGLDVREDDR